MAININKNIANGIVAKTTVSAMDIFDIGDIVIAYEIGTNRTWVPGRAINGFTTFVAEKAYYVIGGNNDLDKEQYFVPRITTPPTGQFRLVTQPDIDAYPQMRFGDYIIDGPNAGTGVYDFPPELGPDARIYIKGGVYEYITLDLINTPGTSVSPVIITNYDGRVDCGVLDLYGANFVVTGEYSVANRTGDPAYTGWDNLDSDGYLIGKFGFRLGIGHSGRLTTAVQFNQDKDMVGNRPSISNITIHNVEVGPSTYSGIAVKQDDVDTLTMDNIVIRDCYIHDCQGESIYLGSTGDDPQHVFNGLRVYNNLIVRSGLNGIQVGQLANDCHVYNNTVVSSAMDWGQAFQMYQDQSTQLQMRKSGASFYNNLVIGGGENFMSIFMKSKTGLTQDNSVTLFQNNGFLYSKNSYASYINLTNLQPFTLRIDNNVFGKYNRSVYEKVYHNFFTTDYEILVDSAVTTATLQFTNNLLDTTNTKGSSFVHLSSNSGITVTQTGNSVQSSVPIPTFKNFMDLPLGYDYTLLENWTNQIGVNYDPSVANSGQIRSYNQGDLVVYHGRMYRSLVNNNSGHQPLGVTDSYWEVVTFTTGNTTNIPDDARLVEGSYYATRGIGMLRYASATGLPTTSTSTTTSTTLAPFTSDDILMSSVDNGDNTFTLKWAVNRNQITTASKFRIVAIGSSTLAGSGASSDSTSLVGRTQQWLTSNTNNGIIIPLSLSGASSELFMPEGYSNINPVLNVDAAISTKPSCALISLPSNDIVNGLTPSQFVNNLLVIYNHFRNYGIPCFVTTTQPRSDASSGQQTNLASSASLIRSSFPSEFVIDVFDLLRDTGAGTAAVLNASYDSGDGIHLNDAGHLILSNEFISKLDDYFQNPSYSEYSVERSTSQNSGFTVFDTVTGGANVSKSYNRSSNEMYYYRVRAKKIDDTYTNYTNVTSVYQPNEVGSLDQEIRVSFKSTVDSADPSDWNKFNGTTLTNTNVGTTFANLEDITDVSSGITLTVTKAFGQVLVGSGGTDAGVYPSSISRSGWTSKISFNDFSQLKFSGLLPTNVYKAEILTSYGSLYNPCLSVRDHSNYNKHDFENSSNYPSSSSGNTTRLITLNGLIPNQSGEIVLDFFPLVYNAGVVCSIVLKRYINSNPQTTTTTTSSSTTTTTTLSQGTSTDINVNIYNGTNAYNNSAWNNWNIGVSDTPLGFTNLKFSDGSSSGINVAWVTGQEFDGVSDNGGSYTGSVDWPSQVLRYAAYTWSAGLTAPNTDEFVISNLNNSYTYTIQLIGSRSGGDRYTYYRCIGATDTTSTQINTNNNSSSVITFSNIAPSSGTIRIRFATVTGNATTGYINAFKIIVNNGTTTTTSSTTSTTTIAGSTTTTTTGITTTTSSTTTTTTIGNVGNIFVDNVYISPTTTRQAYVRTPDDYNITSNTYPLLVFLHGAGEAISGGSSGTGIAKLYANENRGPAYFIQNGSVFNFTNPITGSVEKFIVVCPQADSWSTSAEQLDYVIADVINRYRVNTDKIFLTGLSAGGQGVVEYMMDLNDGSSNPATYIPASVVPMSAAISTPTTQQGLTIVGKNIKVWGFGSFSDIHGEQTYNLVQVINANSNPDLGRWTPYTGGHCCWGTFYNPNYRENIQKSNGSGSVNMNIYEWMLQFTLNSGISTTTTTTGTTSTTTTTTSAPTTTTTTSTTTTTTSGSTTTTTTVVPTSIMNVNLYDSSNANLGIYTNSEWNNWYINLVGASNYAYSPLLNWSDGSPSSVQVRWSTNTVGACVYNYVDNNFGWPSPNNITGFPTETFRVSPFSQVNDTRLRIIGLPTDTVDGYKLQILCSRNTTTSRPVTFSVGSETQTVESMNNNSVLVELDNLTPSGGVIEVDIDFSNGYSYINAFKIIRK